MTITLPDVPVTGTIIESSWGVAVRTALSDLQTQVTALDASLDAAVPNIGQVLVDSNDTEQTCTNSDTDLITLSSFDSIDLTTNSFLLVFAYRKTAGASVDSTLGVKVGTVKQHGDSGVAITGGAADTQRNGWAAFRMYGSASVANYPWRSRLDWIVGTFSGIAPSTPSGVVVDSGGGSPVSSITIYGNSQSASVTLGVMDVSLYLIPRPV